MSIKNGGTRKGTQPNPSAQPKAVNGVIHRPGRNRPAKGFDPATKTWLQG